MVTDRFAPYDWKANRIKHLPSDLTGKKYNNLSVLYRSAYVGNGKKPTVYWVCLCDCGNLTVVSSSGLITGHTKSCGCKHTIHNEAHKTRLYRTWLNMRRRCNNQNNNRYKNYGGRGITVCEEWNNSYISFRNWAYANGYKEDLTIDRIDNNKGYSPENCKWSTWFEQAQNTSRTKRYDFHGEQMTIREIATELGVSYSAIQHRIYRGQPLDGKYKTVSKRSH